MCAPATSRGSVLDGFDHSAATKGSARCGSCRLQGQGGSGGAAQPPVLLSTHEHVAEYATTAVQAASCQMDEVTVIGRSRKRKLELDCSYVTEQLTVDGQQYTFRQVQPLT